MAKHLPVLTERKHAAADLPITLAPSEQRRNWWKMPGKHVYPLMAKAAVRILSMHVTSCACERDWSHWGAVFTKARNRLGIAKAEKIIFVKGNLDLLEGPTERADDAAVMLTVLEESSEGEENP